MESNEEWRDILGFEGAYQISNLGRVRSLDRDIYYMNHGTLAVLHKKGMILKQTPDADGYLRVGVICEGRSKNFGVHRLVAQAFIPNPENLPCVNHKDYDKTNNCVNNLEWCTVEYNNKYSNNEERRPHSIYENRETDSFCCGRFRPAMERARLRKRRLTAFLDGFAGECLWCRKRHGVHSLRRAGKSGCHQFHRRAHQFHPCAHRAEKHRQGPARSHHAERRTAPHSFPAGQALFCRTALFAETALDSDLQLQGVPRL